MLERRSVPMTSGGKGLQRTFVLSSSAMVALFSALLLLPGVYANDDDGSEHDYHNDPFTVLLFTFVMSFATMAVLVSVFAIKFGSKRSKLLALPLLLSGLVPWGIWVFFRLVLRSKYPDDTFLGLVHWVAAPIIIPLMALAGFAAGVGLGLFIFLTIVVRS